jgi:hypothetical protein
VADDVSVPDQPADEAAPTPPLADQPTPFTDDHKPSKLAWASLGVLGVAALALPFLREPVLFADDFSGPQVLRTWPEDGTNYAYGEGTYELTVLGKNDAPTAVQDLPHTVSGMTIEVDAHVSTGEGLIGADCIADYGEVDNADGTKTLQETTAYIFAVAADGYAIADTTGALDSGPLSGDPTDGLTFECISDGSDMILRVRAGDGDPVEFVDVGGGTTFRAFALSGYASKDGAEVVFDDVRVIEATSEETA